MRKLLHVSILAILAFVVYLNYDSYANRKFYEEQKVQFHIEARPFAPKDLVANANPQQLVEFAWEEFLALNWKSSYNTNGKRDYPDTSWSYESDNAPYPDLNVWETYAHRSELRPYNDKMLPFDAPPHYSFGTPFKKGGNASFTLFDNLDENNEIGSCNLYAHAKAGSFDTTQPQVLYQAKANRDEYNYVLQNYKTSALLDSATARTAYNIKTYNAYYPGAKTTCYGPTGKNGVICLPCGGAQVVQGPSGLYKGTYTGAMEIKSAWRELTAQDDSTKFFTRKVIYYYSRIENKKTVYYYGNKTYALIGLHIIHKTQNYPAFVFATFEHIGVRADSMRYSLTSPDSSHDLRVPHTDPIAPITQQSTDFVHQMLPKQSIWQNYRLVGVQAAPTDSVNSFSFYLANYVVESDYDLSHFRGSSIGNAHDNGKNVLLRSKRYSMGGCQGCHGAGQINFGTDFSFLMDTFGKPVLAPDTSNATDNTKLKRYIRAFELAKLKLNARK